MAVDAGEVAPGEFFMTRDRELRKVYRVVADGQGVLRVWYQCKPAALPCQPLLFGHAQADPPALADFVVQCAYRVREPELRALHDSGVLLQFE